VTKPDGIGARSGQRMFGLGVGSGSVFYTVWFYLGWRSSEIVALRFGWVDFERQHIKLQRGRIPRMGGLEAEPKTGRRQIDCSYAPAIFETLERLRERAISTTPEDFVFTNQSRRPLDQEWLNDHVWKPTLRSAGIGERGQYCIRDTFISLALSSGEDPGWVLPVCRQGRGSRPRSCETGRAHAAKSQNRGENSSPVLNSIHDCGRVFPQPIFQHLDSQPESAKKRSFASIAEPTGSDSRSHAAAEDHTSNPSLNLWPADSSGFVSSQPRLV